MSNTVPEGWEVKTVGDIGSVVTGSTPSTTEPLFWGGVTPFISPADFDGKIYIDKTSRTLSEEGTKKARELPKDAILVTCIGSLGGMALTSKPSVTNQQINAVVAEENQESRFHFYNILFNMHELIKSAGTTTLPIINKSTFSQINLLFPPLPEQQKIATILSSVDDVIEKTRAQIDKLKDLKTGMMQELLTKGIGHTEFKDSPIGRIPQGWVVYTAQELLDLKVLLKLQDGNHGSQYPRAAEFISSGVPYIAASHISEFGEISFNSCPHLSQTRADDLRIRPAKGGDVILTHNATVGRTAIIPDNKGEVIASTSTTYYRTNNSKLLNKYLYYYFQSTAYVSQLQSIMGQTTRNQVPITAQRELLIIVPPIEDQASIANVIEVIVSKIRAKRAQYNNLLLLKKALMQDLLTGKVRVKTQKDMLKNVE